MGVNFRSAQNRDEVEQVFDFILEDNPQLSRHTLSNKVIDHPTFELWQTRIAEKNGEIVGTIQIFHKKIWLHGVQLPIAGLGHFRIDSNADFEAAALFEHTLNLLKEFGHSLVIVFSEDTRLFENLGLFPMPLIEYKFEKFAAYDTKGVRPFDEGKDLPRVMEIYHTFNSDRDGPICRTENDWRAQVEFYTGDSYPFWVIEQEGSVVGYLRGYMKSGHLEITEFGGLKSYASYFRKMMTVMFSELDFYTVKLNIRREEPFFNAAYIPARQKTDARMMWKILDEEKLASQLNFKNTDELSEFIKRLRDFQITFWRSDAF